MASIVVAQQEEIADPKAPQPWVPWDEEPDPTPEVPPPLPAPDNEAVPGAAEDPMQLADMTYLPGAPRPDVDTPPVDPASMFEEYAATPSPEGPERVLGIREVVWQSLNEGKPFRMIYTSLLGTTSERVVHPDYVYWAGTGRHVMVAWDELRNDWRQFIVDRIRDAELEGA